ncbi:hypothetical protein IKN40_04900 [bacterium]|nr:hypothetical protein [bacterium]
MITENEIIEDIKSIKRKVELMKNPLYTDYCGSYLWGEIYDKLEDIENIINK